MVTILTALGRNACLAFVLFLTASALSAGHRGVSVSIDDGRDPADCEDLSITIDGDRAERAQETIRVPDTPGQVLRVRVPDHSGIRVVGTDRNDVEVVACKASSSSADLPRISVVSRGGEISVRSWRWPPWPSFWPSSGPRPMRGRRPAASPPG